MSKLKVFEKILHSKFKPADQAVLVEKNLDKNGKVFEMKYPIISDKLEYLVFKFDPEIEDIFPYFSETSGLKKICDYVVLAEEGSLLYVFLVELKLGPIPASKQLKAAKEFIKYVIETSRRIGHELDEDIYIRMIRICEKYKGRGPTKEQNIEYSKEGYHDYRYQNFRLKHLMHY